ncbi:hypothetical protein Tco_1147194 [Tanacetum coccineum]
MPRECLRFIESKSKVRNSRNKAVVALTTEVSELKNMMKTMLIDKQKAQAPATVKTVEQSCVTYGGAHSYRNCPAIDGSVYRDNIQEYISQAAAANFNQGNTNSRPPMANDVILRNMQNQGHGLQNQMTNLMEMISKLISSNTASSSNSGPLTPLVPTTVVSTPPKEPEQNPETSMDKVQKPGSESTARVAPPEDHDSIFIRIPKPKAKETVQEPNSPYPNSYHNTFI